MHLAAARFGVISDTHGLLRPQAAAALAGVERIVHAGDVGRVSVLHALERIAPVTAVRGNVDRDDGLRQLPMTAEIALGDHWLHVRHIVDELDLDPAAAGFAAVIYGHSHVPSIEWRRGVLWLNPGSAGPRRFRLPVTLARLELVEGRLIAELVELDPAT